MYVIVFIYQDKVKIAEVGHKALGVHRVPESTLRDQIWQFRRVDTGIAATQRRDRVDAIIRVLNASIQLK